MPQRTFYLRKDDEELWEALPNKAEAISKMLNGVQFSSAPEPKKEAPPEKQTSEKISPPSAPKLCREHLLEKKFCINMKHKL